MIRIVSGGQRKIQVRNFSVGHAAERHRHFVFAYVTARRGGPDIFDFAGTQQLDFDIMRRGELLHYGIFAIEKFFLHPLPSRDSVEAINRRLDSRIVCRRRLHRKICAQDLLDGLRRLPDLRQPVLRFIRLRNREIFLQRIRRIENFGFDAFYIAKKR